MAKYTEAFCTTTGGMVSIMQMRSEYNHDPAVYEKVYKGHLFCQQDRHQSISNKRCCDKENYHGADNILGCMGTSYDRSASITAIDPATYSHCVPRWAFGVANSRDEASSYVLP